MKVEFTSKSAKQFKKISKNGQVKLLKKIEDLSAYPYSGKILKGNLRKLRSIRVWPYRIVYKIDKVITIHSVAHRKSVYNIN